MLGNTFLVLCLKELIAHTGVLLLLPDAMGTPLAFAAIPGGAPLMEYLMCMAHAASQISPTHVCLVVAADYFHVTLGDIVKKTLPVSIAFCVLMTLYYNVIKL